MQRRAHRNPMLVQQGRSKVLASLNTVDDRCNDDMDQTLAAPAVGFMQCNADVFDGGHAAAAQGTYNAQTCTHAEMNALAAYIGNHNDFGAVTSIEITSPPCKSCAFVLELLGLIDAVVTTGPISKHFTGSWRWPDALQNHNLFANARWHTVRGWFVGSGLTDAEVVERVVQVVRSKSSN